MEKPSRKVEPHLTIAGAGLTGSLLSIMLRKRGIPLRLFERRPDPRQAKIQEGRSINLAISHRGLRALELIGLKEQVLKLAIPMCGRLLHKADGTTEFIAYSHHPEECIYALSRASLNILLLEAAIGSGVQVQFDSAVQSVEPNHILKLSNGQKESFKTLLACDGASSKIRPFIGATEGGLEDLDYEYKELVLPANPQGEHQIFKEALHIWPRKSFMLIALPNQEGSFTCTLFHSKSFFKEMNSKGLAGISQFFETEFPDFVKLCPDYANQFQKNPTGHLSTLRTFPWTKDNVLLLGDAAHAVVPFYGQGMNCCFEDCRIFMEIFDEVEMGKDLDTSSTENWKKIFQEFQKRRKPHCDALAQMALDNFIDMRSGAINPKQAKMKKVETKLMKLYGEDYLSQYHHVTFHSTPYALALELTEAQKKLLDILVEEENTDNWDPHVQTYLRKQKSIEEKYHE